ncbi:MAG: metal ABC transporter substrate-binding protein [bacterium]|nr:metal ABC transporter substrate-binding protein [bacterium]
MRLLIPLFIFLLLQPSLARSQGVLTAANYPLSFLLEQLGGSDYQVVNLMPPGLDPHDYRPGLTDLTRASSAKLLVYNSAPGEPWADRLAQEIERQGGRVIRLSEYFPSSNQKHGPDLDAGEDRHEHGFDPHLWLDPMMFLEVAELLADQLGEMNAPAKTRIQSRLDQLGAKLKALDQQYAQGLAKCQGRTMVVSHDAWDYLTTRYHLKSFALHELSAQSQTSLRQMVSAVNEARTSGADAIFYESLSDNRLSRTLAQETGLALLELHPLGNRSLKEAQAGLGYFELMHANLSHLRRGLGCSR